MQKIRCGGSTILEIPSIESKDNNNTHDRHISVATPVLDVLNTSQMEDLSALTKNLETESAAAWDRHKRM